MTNCSICGVGLVKSEETKGVCYKCEQNGSISVAELRKRERDAAAAENKALHSIILTTETYPIGLEIKERVEIITAECVFGMNLFRDLFSGVRDIVGGRSGATQNVLRDARNTALNELRQEAFDIGANGVIGVSLAYSEISGGGKSMLFIVASGTAVILANAA